MNIKKIKSLSFPLNEITQTFYFFTISVLLIPYGGKAVPDGTSYLLH
jgi:hypothetical protein